MPSLGLPITVAGPVIELHVGVSSPRLAAIKAAGLPDPPLIVARMLVDTGASNTNLCHSIISQLGIAPTGSVQVHTPSTGNVPVPMDQYDVNLYLNLPMKSGSQSDIHTIQTIPIIGTDFSKQGIHGLIGRDILANATLIYHGNMNMFMLAF